MIKNISHASFLVHSLLSCGFKVERRDLNILHMLHKNLCAIYDLLQSDYFDDYYDLSISMMSEIDAIYNLFNGLSKFSSTSEKKLACLSALDRLSDIENDALDVAREINFSEAV